LDRFTTTAAVLDGFASGRFDPAAPESWLEPLERAGIHPASLLLCSSARDLPRLAPLKPLMERVGPSCELVPSISYDTIVAWSPLTYAHEIEHWNLATGAASRQDGCALPDHLLSIRGVTVREDPVRTLGRNWALVGSLRLLDLPRLQTVPGPLEVFGDLELDGLPELRELGPGIQVHGNLTVSGCPNLLRFSRGLMVEGSVWLDAVPKGFDPGGLGPRIQSPWPGVAPRPVAVQAYPPGAVNLAAQ